MVKSKMRFFKRLRNVGLALNKKSAHTIILRGRIIEPIANDKGQPVVAKVKVRKRVLSSKPIKIKGMSSSRKY